MMRRLTWFIGGAVAGVATAGYAKRKVRATAAQLAPVQVARQTGERVRTRGRTVADAVREGRSAARAREAELRARLDGRAFELDQALEPGDSVLVDGLPVEPGQVIVLRQVREERPARRRSL